MRSDQVAQGFSQMLETSKDGDHAALPRPVSAPVGTAFPCLTDPPQEDPSLPQLCLLHHIPGGGADGDCKSSSPSWDNLGGDYAERATHRQGNHSDLPC